MKPSAQCATAAGIMAGIPGAFTYCDIKIWMGLYKTYVQPHLEFAVEAWSPWETFRHRLPGKDTRKTCETSKWTCGQNI
jgi:hypothetical protein